MAINVQNAVQSLEQFEVRFPVWRAIQSGDFHSSDASQNIKELNRQTSRLSKQVLPLLSEIVKNYWTAGSFYCHKYAVQRKAGICLLGVAVLGFYVTSYRLLK
ncbi:MAG: hypothetical protein COT84_03560 [Chlamydiae bacterium CG10_big_fil_rev_8_21_14_0_10_35_9]|nr:MAG: hypothetical protein COT84_03560 [Chlamydiae bacterium CG10_big_fil_rev_8_21_14_0_10_35_9]